MTTFRSSTPPTSPLLDLLNLPQARTTIYSVQRHRALSAHVLVRLNGSAYGVRHELGAVTRIGSGADCELRLPGLADCHAEIEHRDDDEFWLIHRAPDADTFVDGVSVSSTVLVPDAVLSLGTWRLHYSRDEVEVITTEPHEESAAGNDLEVAL